MIATKKCVKCGRKKALVLFYNDSSRSDGRQPYCKACRRPEDRRYHLTGTAIVRDASSYENA